jgi:hypothetical protein
MYKLNSEVAEILDELDALVMRCVDGNISFDEFLEKYGYPMGYYALDGHESDEQGKSILADFAKRIALHQAITDRVLHKVCTPEQVADPAYKSSSRIKPSEAHLIFKEVVASHVPLQT